MTVLVQITAHIEPNPLKWVRGDTFHRRIVWSEGTLDELIDRFMQECVDRAIVRAKAALTEDEKSSERLSWLEHPANRAAIAEMYDPLRIETYRNELPDPETPEALRLDRVRAVQATIGVLEELITTGRAFALQDLQEAKYSLHQVAARIAVGAR